jgi:hypothetical protein
MSTYDLFELFDEDDTICDLFVYGHDGKIIATIKGVVSTPVRYKGVWAIPSTMFGEKVAYFLTYNERENEDAGWSTVGSEGRAEDSDLREELATIVENMPDLDERIWEGEETPGVDNPEVLVRRVDVARLIRGHATS